MMLSSLMQELAKELEMEGFAQDVPGVFTVPLEEGVTFSVGNGVQGGVYLSGNVAQIGKGQLEGFFTQALLGNLFGQGTKGGVLGLNENGSILTLSRQVEYDINYKDFRDIVEDFINTLDFWKEEAQKYQ